MFESLAGCMGHLFARRDDTYLTISMWVGRHAIRAAEESEIYSKTVADIMATGVLRGRQTVEVFEISALNMGFEPSDSGDTAADTA